MKKSQDSSYHEFVVSSKMVHYYMSREREKRAPTIRIQDTFCSSTSSSTLNNGAGSSDPFLLNFRSIKVCRGVYFHMKAHRICMFKQSNQTYN